MSRCLLSTLLKSGSNLSPQLPPHRSLCLKMPLTFLLRPHFLNFTNPFHVMCFMTNSKCHVALTYELFSTVPPPPPSLPLLLLLLASCCPFTSSPSQPPLSNTRFQIRAAACSSPQSCDMPLPAETQPPRFRIAPPGPTPGVAAAAAQQPAAALKPFALWSKTRKWS